MSRAEWIHLALSPSEKKFACWPPPLGHRVSLLKLPNYDHDNDQFRAKTKRLAWRTPASAVLVSGRVCECFSKWLTLNTDKANSCIRNKIKWPLIRIYPFEILFEDIVTIEDETTQLKTDQEQEEECWTKITVMGNTKEPSYCARKVKKINCHLESIHLKSKKKIYCYLVKICWNH